MNSKGSFSAIIGVALIVLIATIGFTYYSSGLSQKALLEQQDALEARQHWTNLRYLLDKAAAEAVFDSVQDKSGCNSLSGFNSKLGLYFKSIIDKSFSCSYSGLSNNANDLSAIKINFVLTCSKANSVSYSMPVAFDKRLEISGTPLKCRVFDNQGNFEEISAP